jgi:hypothetical protein
VSAANRAATPQAPARSEPETEMSGWDARQRGVVVLPSGRLVYGRSLRKPVPEGHCPDFGIYFLLGHLSRCPGMRQWVWWWDFGSPSVRLAAYGALAEAWDRASVERVEVACSGGQGRTTGTALACLAVLDGVPAREAVSYIRRRFDPRAVETPSSRRYVARFPAP